jgi:hypothetical protein
MRVAAGEKVEKVLAERGVAIGGCKGFLGWHEVSPGRRGQT